jgi:hypothetical protein
LELLQASVAAPSALQVSAGAGPKNPASPNPSTQHLPVFSNPRLVAFVRS